MFGADKTRMFGLGLPYGKKNYDNMLSRFHPIPERYGQTDRQTDIIICYINIKMLINLVKCHITEWRGSRKLIWNAYP